MVMWIMSGVKEFGKFEVFTEERRREIMFEESEKRTITALEEMLIVTGLIVWGEAGKSMVGKEDRILDFRSGREEDGEDAVTDVEDVKGRANGCSTETDMWRADGGYMYMQLGSTDASSNALTTPFVISS
jgi:hypothetical protein